MFKRGKTVLSTVALSATLAVTALVTSSPAQAASTPKDPGAIFVVTTNHEDLSAGILREAARKPAYREQALALAERWESDLSAGQAINLGAMTEGRSPADGSAAASRLKDDLTALSGKSAASSVTEPTAPAMAPMESGLNPNGFPVSGFPNNTYPSTYWSMGMTVDGTYCTSSGCTLRDEISCQARINPGVLTSMVSYNCLYSPNAGNFQNKHYEWWTINRGTVKGTNDTGNLFSGSGGSGTFNPTSNTKLNGSVLTIALALWVYAVPANDYLKAVGKTSDATCLAAPDTRCLGY